MSGTKGLPVLVKKVVAIVDLIKAVCGVAGIKIISKVEDAFDASGKLN